MRVLVLLALVLCASASAANAQSLYYVGISDSGMAVAERDSIEWRDGRPRIDLHTIYTTPLAFEKVYGTGYDWVQRTTAEYEIDCAGSRGRTLSFKFFTFAGAQTGGGGEVSNWQAFSENSVLSDLRDLACKNILPSDTHFDSLAAAAYIYYGVANEAEEDED